MTTDALKTPLYQLHCKLAAKMAPFAGYQMPIQYANGILWEHNHTREKAGLFDVSHMGQIKLSGKNAASALEKLVPASIVDLAVGQQRYAVFTNQQGHILDDLMVSNLGDDSLFLVVNAACKHDDLKHLQKNLAADITIDYLEDKALLALQGPRAASVLTQLAPSVASLRFMSGLAVTIQGIECYVTRSGYTGEDGFEISLPATECENFAAMLLAFDDVAMIGLGARDSLRLEAGLCLYGHDITDQTSPVEANLVWSIAKSRRPGGERAGGYLGSDLINQQLQKGVARKRVGLLPQGKAPIRDGSLLLDKNEKPVGEITSGGFSPTLGKPIAMGYVDINVTSEGTELLAMVRNKPLPITVAPLPFVKHNYFRS